MRHYVIEHVPVQYGEFCLTTYDFHGCGGFADAAAAGEDEQRKPDKFPAVSAFGAVDLVAFHFFVPLVVPAFCTDSDHFDVSFSIHK